MNSRDVVYATLFHYMKTPINDTLETVINTFVCHRL
jgi:hypothetical protein